MTKTIDITRIGMPQETCESVVNLPERYEDCESYLVGWRFDGKPYGRVYPGCPHADLSYIDRCGDFYCKRSGIIIFCGPETPFTCPLKTHTIEDGPQITYWEYMTGVRS